jgi:hypothetical protein
MKDTLLFPLKEKENPLLQFKFLDLDMLTNFKKLKVPIMKVVSEKIHNGLKMDLVSLQQLMLSISDFLDIIFIILKLMLTWLSLELLPFITLLPPLEEMLHVSLLLMMKMTDGLFVLLMKPPHLIGFALFPKFLDYLALKKKKLFMKKSSIKFNLC